jgi:hypothetical protein
MWQRSFVAVSVLVGASIDDALACVPPGSEATLGDLPARLRHREKLVRAQALASVVHDVAAALDEVTLA